MRGWSIEGEGACSGAHRLRKTDDGGWKLGAVDGGPAAGLR
jgi:hypothetical protein